MPFGFQFGFQDLNPETTSTTDTGLSCADINQGLNGGPASTQDSEYETESSQAGFSPEKHTVEGLISSLPSRLSYSVLLIKTPSGQMIRLPRRELFDIKIQLMTEDEEIGEETNDSVGTSTTTTSKKLAKTDVAALNDSDIRTNVYEGGFKTWECAIDLVKHLSDHQNEQVISWKDNGSTKPRNLIEFGCGTALPSLALFQSLLTQPGTTTRPTSLILADYNVDVLRLCTLPNLFLIFCTTLSNNDVAGVATAATSTASTQPPSEEDDPTIVPLPENPNPLAGLAAALESEIQSSPSSSSSTVFELEGDVHVTPELKQAFLARLNELAINISFISGSWSPSSQIVSLLTEEMKVAPSTAGGAGVDTLLLGSETIYSPTAVRQFSRLLIDTLKQATEQAKETSTTIALIAAKREYFGVGGSVYEFEQTVTKFGGHVEQIGEMGTGVGRCLMKVRLRV